MTPTDNEPTELQKAVDGQFNLCVKKCAEELLKNPDDHFVIKAISESFEPLLSAVKQLSALQAVNEALQDDIVKLNNISVNSTSKVHSILQEKSALQKAVERLENEVSLASYTGEFPDLTRDITTVCDAAKQLSDLQVKNYALSSQYEIIGLRIVAQKQEMGSKIQMLEEQLSVLQQLGIKTLDAKWLDPECHEGCQSLVLKDKMTALQKENEELKDKQYPTTPICSVCGWTNVGCLNLGEVNQKSEWVCHGCIKRERDSLTAALKECAEVLKCSVQFCDDTKCEFGKPHHTNCTIAKNDKALSNAHVQKLLKS